MIIDNIGQVELEDILNTEETESIPGLNIALEIAINNKKLLTPMIP